MGCICGENIKDGEFICPICKKKSGFDKWQKRGNKWIFHRDNGWYGSLYGSSFYSDIECWKRTGGDTVENWDKIEWICSICKYPSPTFFDYIPDYSGTKEYVLGREKRKTDFLTKELIDHKIDNILLNEEANLYSSALLKQRREIQSLNERVKEMEEQTELEDETTEDRIAITFKSTDNIINMAMACKITDPFVKVEGKLYEEYPEYKNSNYLFTANGQPVKRFQTLEENNIKNSDTILLNVI